ncbi:MAG: M24 family metallopeptidase [Pseudomonadota bacterium]|nr:M24 family metallopeptidase [Pseudomonadota bacterium]
MSVPQIQQPQFSKRPLPPKFCNIDRLLESMSRRNIDGIVVSTPYNVYYLSGFSGIAHKSDEPRPYAVVISRHVPDQPILLLADYYVSSLASQATWINDVRSFRAVMLPLDLPPSARDIDRFISPVATDDGWVRNVREHFSSSVSSACRDALADLGLSGGRVAFDDLRFGFQLGLDDLEVIDGYDPMMYARAVKTDHEIVLLKRATALNQLAIEQAISTWQRGMTWREFNHAYHCAAVGLGGFVRDPGAMVWGHPRGADATVMLQTGLDDFEILQGTHVMFDCHGTLDLYCWDGGKTWVVDGEVHGDAKRYAAATSEATAVVLDAMRPGARICELQAIGRSVYRKGGIAAADSVLIFFHGLGLSHMDLEQVTAEGMPNADWQLEAGMVVPLHILYPGADNERIWVEEVAKVTVDGGEPFFTWGYDPISGH